jgi:hypothetical protein
VCGQKWKVLYARDPRGPMLRSALALEQEQESVARCTLLILKWSNHQSADGTVAHSRCLQPTATAGQICRRELYTANWKKKHAPMTCKQMSVSQFKRFGHRDPAEISAVAVNNMIGHDATRNTNIAFSQVMVTGSQKKMWFSLHRLFSFCNK